MKNGKLASILILSAVALCATSLSLVAQTLPPLPGINAPDPQAKGCVACHVVADGKDFRLTVVLNSIKGGHPDVTKIVKNVPVDCLKCHFASAKAPVLGSMVHRNHYDNQTASNTFLANDKGSCLSCHTIDTSSGKIAIKNAPANW